MTEKPINTVEDILAGTIKNGFDGSIQTAERFIFGELDSILPYSQKRAFLTAVEGMHYRDNHGQDHIRPTFTLVETGIEPDIAQGVRNELSSLCEAGLLKLISESPCRYAFTDAGFVFIANYFTLREFHEGGGRAKLPPDLSFRTVILPSIPTSAKSFIQLLKSIQRRSFEANTGNLMWFQDKDAHDYESVTRLAYSFQTPIFLIDPAMSFEVIPLEQSRVKVIAQCYHILAQESFELALREISETWPEAAGLFPNGEALPPAKCKLPTRKSDKAKWAATWRLIQEWVDKGMNAADIEGRLSQSGGVAHLPGDVRTLRKIIEAGKAGCFDNMP